MSYRYGADGALVSVNYPAVTGTSTGNDFPEGATRHLQLRGGQLLTGITDRAGGRCSTSSTAPPSIASASARCGRDARQPGPLRLSPDLTARTLLAIVNDGNGNVRELHFDKAGRCLATRDYTARADPARPTTVSTTGRAARCATTSHRFTRRASATTTPTAC